MLRKTHLLIIDPQNDFCNPKGSLFIDGAVGDSERLSDFIRNFDDIITDIHVTLDSHHKFDIAHPSFWVDVSGKSPLPFTPISKKDVESGKYLVSNSEYKDHALDYVSELESSGRYGHFIWPEHCLIGTWGTSIEKNVMHAINNWCISRPGRMINFVNKGTNCKTEHFSAIRAEVPDPNDPSTQVNASLLKSLREADEIIISGQALSHCVANTVRDIADNFKPEEVKKIVLLTDTTSPVGDLNGFFKKIGEDFIRELKEKGMRTEKTKSYE